MYFDHDGDRWWINVAPSAFTSRAGKMDVSVHKESAWGRRNADGNLYKCCLRLGAEDGCLVRDYEAVPLFVTVEWLRDKGFIGKQAKPSEYLDQ